MELRTWNEKLKYLKRIILKSENFEEAIEIFLDIHAMVYCSEMSKKDLVTFEDELWEGLDDLTIRTVLNEKGRTIAYGLWHSTRIEDITMNILVNGGDQVINGGGWIYKIEPTIISTGNELSTEEILEFSQMINIEELKKYRIAVGRRTEEIIKSLKSSDMKRKMDQAALQRIIDEGAVSKEESAFWLIDFWGRKNVSGLLLMPAARHHVVHINESLSAKKKAKNKKC